VPPLQRVFDLAIANLVARLHLRRLDNGIRMKLSQCQNCGQPLYFENTRCES
jgi:hypothetical protein